MLAMQEQLSVPYTVIANIHMKLINKSVVVKECVVYSHTPDNLLPWMVCILRLQEQILGHLVQGSIFIELNFIHFVEVLYI